MEPLPRSGNLAIRVWVYTGLLALILGFMWYLHWSGVRQGRADAEESRLEHQQSILLATKQAAQAQLLSARQAQDRADRNAALAHAQHILRKEKVQAIAPNMLRVRTDTGVVVVPVPTEVTELLSADSARIATLQVQVFARDTTEQKLATVAAINDTLLVVKDSITQAVKDRPQGRAKAVIVTTVVVLGIARLVTWALGK